MGDLMSIAAKDSTLKYAYESDSYRNAGCLYDQETSCPESEASHNIFFEGVCGSEEGIEIIACKVL